MKPRIEGGGGKAKVTPMQRETIRTLAARCGMTVSDYLLTRSHDYEPNHQLTSQQNELPGTLDNCRRGYRTSQQIINNHFPIRETIATEQNQFAVEFYCSIFNTVIYQIVSSIQIFVM